MSPEEWSGREPESHAKAHRRLLDIIRERSFKTGRFRLASGVESSYYVDLRRTTTHPEGAYLAAHLLLELISPFAPDAAGGPTLGADPLTGALALLSYRLGRPLRTFMVRAGSKDHGMEHAIEGSLEPGDRVVILDDVVTSGASLLRVVDPVRRAGGEIVAAAAVLDRQQGASEALAARGIRLQSLYKLSDLFASGATSP